MKINNQIVINLAAVNYIDSGGLGTLVGARLPDRVCDNCGVLTGQRRDFLVLDACRLEAAVRAPFPDGPGPVLQIGFRRHGHSHRSIV